MLIATPKRMRSSYGVVVWSWISVAYFVVVVLGGAVVRTSGAGAGCGDRWPLCNGEFIPHHPRLVTIIEFSHRSTTFVAVVLFAVMILWTFRATSKGHPARKAAVWTALLLITESALGAVLVLRHLVDKNASFERVAVQSVHFSNTMLLLGAAALTPFFLTATIRQNTRIDRFRTISIITVILTLLTGAAGALAALADTIYPSASLNEALRADFSPFSPALLHMRWLHPAGAFLMSIFCCVLICRYFKCNRRMAAFGLSVILFLQFAIGAVDVLLLAPTWCQLLHLLAADCFWIGLVTATAPEVFQSESIGRASRSVKRSLVKT